MKLGISVEFAEAAGEHLRAETRASHAEHDGVLESLAANLFGKRLEIIRVRQQQPE